MPEGSVGSPRVVDHEAPGAVCLTTENVRDSGRVSVTVLAVRPGSRE